MTRGEPVVCAVADPAAVARALRHPVRRATVAVLLERDAPMAVDALANAVCARAERDGSCEEGSGHGVRTALVHRHLPILRSANLVSAEPAGVLPGDNRLLARPEVCPAALSREEADWDALGVVCGQPRRQLTLAVLSSAALPVDLWTLARAVAAERAGDLSADAPAIADLATRLHHVDLPMLDDVDVLSYDDVGHRVTAISRPDVPVPLLGL